MHCVFISNSFYSCRLKETLFLACILSFMKVFFLWVCGLFSLLYFHGFCYNPISIVTKPSLIYSFKEILERMRRKDGRFIFFKSFSYFFERWSVYEKLTNRWRWFDNNLPFIWYNDHNRLRCYLSSLKVITKVNMQEMFGKSKGKEGGGGGDCQWCSRLRSEWLTIQDQVDQNKLPENHRFRKKKLEKMKTVRQRE